VPVVVPAAVLGSRAISFAAYRRSTRCSSTWVGGCQERHVITAGRLVQRSGQTWSFCQHLSKAAAAISFEAYRRSTRCSST
jgi:hypothetical protein